LEVIVAVGKWFAEIYPGGTGQPEVPREFDDFPQALAFVKAFKTGPASSDLLRVHAPAAATDQERRDLIDLGATLV
jgi:hypothetical protein